MNSVVINDIVALLKKQKNPEKSEKSYIISLVKNGHL